MGNTRQRKQKGLKRKRKVIDLDSLSKKHRKLYREEWRRHKTPKDDERETKTELCDTEDDNAVEKEDDPSSSSEDEGNPYQQLVQTLTSNQSKSSQPHKDTDEEDSDEQISEDSSDDQDDDTDIAGKLQLAEQKETSADAVKENSGIDKADNNGSDSNDDDDDEEEDNDIDKDDSNDEGDVAEDDLEGMDYEDDTDLEEDSDNTLLETDPFFLHFEKDLDEKIAEELILCRTPHREEMKISDVGPAFYHWYHNSLKMKTNHRRERDLTKAHVRQSLSTTFHTVNKKLCGEKNGNLTGFQNAMFDLLNNYQDVFYTERDEEKGEQLRLLYCLHALNHILKTRKRVISHNTKLKQKKQLAVDEEYRDQGLTRPKVLMILPFRDAAKRVVDNFIQLLNHGDQGFVANKKRFHKEYSLPPEDEPRKGYKPDDFEATFAGNIDDHFRIGISVAKKTLKLYTKFYSSDIILASPLGMRMLIGGEGDKERDYDFLSSIEVLVIDQADVLMMQNWDHVMHVMKHMHLQPQESHGVDFSRVRMWTLNGWSKLYRQTLVFSSVPVPEITAVFNKHCHNYAGKYSFIRQPTSGSICQIATQLPQVFHRVESSSYSQVPDDRFDFFTKKIFPQLSSKNMSQTLIFIPSYFDFVRLRNYFKREEISVLQISEYSKEKTVNTARNLFYHKRVPYLLYTERFHFYKRVRIRGIKHLVFYGLPQYPQFYSEMCNMLHDVKSKTRADNQTCMVLYTKFDVQRLAEIVGTERAGHMINSKKSVHMFVTGENG